MKLASGTVDRPPIATSALNVMASIAPSEAPAETPSVSGEASGLRSSAWKTTPDSASALPTSAAASTRGRRAMKKICASMFVGIRLRAVEDVAEADAGAAGERRQQAGSQRKSAEAGERPRESTPDRRRAARKRLISARASGTTVR